MVQATEAHTTNPSGVTLTRKGERYAGAHSHKNQGGPRPAPRSRRKPLRITEHRRERIEAIVDTLLELLDETEADPDLEPAGDEQDDDRQDEPALGWTSTFNQTSRHRGLDEKDDLEDEHDGREPCCEDEGAQCDDEGAYDARSDYTDDFALRWQHGDAEKAVRP